MNRNSRIAIEIFSPPFLAASIFTGVGFSVDAQVNVRDLPLVFAWVLAMTCVFGAVPTIVYATVMEKAFSRGVDPGSRQAVILSSVLGVLAGVATAIAVSMGNLRETEAKTMIGLGVIGGAVGALVGLLIWFGSRSRKDA